MVNICYNSCLLLDKEPGQSGHLGNYFYMTMPLPKQRKVMLNLYPVSSIFACLVLCHT